MHVLYFILLLAALICFLLAAFGVRVGRVGLLPLGLAFWVAVPFLVALQGL